MAKVKLNPIVDQVSGGLGDLVFREVNGQTVLSRRPGRSNTVPSAGQLAHQDRFRQAVAYGRFAMADAGLRPLYEAAAARKGLPVFSLTVADFFNAPSLDILDLSAYTGEVGDLIKIAASDDMAVDSVTIQVTDQQNNLIESGAANETPVGAGRWVYTATASVPAGATVTITAVASDLPGGTAVQTQVKSL